MKKVYFALACFIASVSFGQGCPNTLTQAQLFTASGFTGAGIKSRALAPLVVDVGAAATGTLDSQWTAHSLESFGGVVQGSPAVEMLQNQTAPFNATGTAVSAPHPYVTRILSRSYGFGQNGGPEFDFTQPSGDYAFRAERWVQYDPGFQWGVVQPPDDYLNEWTWVIGTYGVGIINHNPTPIIWHPNEPGIGWGDYRYNAGNTYTYAGNVSYPPVTGSSGGPTGTGSGIVDGTVKWNWVNAGTPFVHEITMDSYGDTIKIPDDNNHNTYWNNTNAFPWGRWTKQVIEVYATVTDGLAAGGHITVYENNDFAHPLVDYHGSTDETVTDAGSVRGLLFGGRVRDQGVTAAANNFIHLADLRFDMTAGNATPGAHVATVYVGENCTFTTPPSCTKMVMQPYLLSWSDTSVSFNFWKAELDTGATGYVLIQPEHGALFYTNVSATIQ